MPSNMYLSCLQIDIGGDPSAPRPGRLWLRNPYRVHQRLCMAFPSDPRKKLDPAFLAPYIPADFDKQVHVPRSSGRGFLFRVDPLRHDRSVILVLSSTMPDWTYAFQNAIHLLAAEPQVKDHDPKLVVGERLRFRLHANPVRNDLSRRTECKGSKRGKRVPLRKPDDQITWLRERLVKSGATLLDTPPVLARSEGIRTVRRPERDGDQPIYQGVLFEGVLEVQNPDKLTEAIRAGIGPGKAFGFGLLSLARVT